jgi:hypothetical protein
VRVYGNEKKKEGVIGMVSRSGRKGKGKGDGDIDRMEAEKNRTWSDGLRSDFVWQNYTYDHMTTDRT